MHAEVAFTMVQVILWLLLLFFVTIGSAQGQRPQDDAAAREVLKLEEAGRLKTLKGELVWDELISDGAYMIGPDGIVVIYKTGKPFPPYPIRSFALGEMIARPYGDVVVVTGLADVEAGTPEKPGPRFQMRFLNVWRKSREGWKMVVTERTAVRDSVRQ